MLKIYLKGTSILFFLLLLAQFLSATGEEYTPNEENDHLISNWEYLPFKNQKIDNDDWLETVNSEFNPNAGNWTFSAENISFKCLSYGASTVNDWFNLQYGLTMSNYKSYINGVTENGTNPRYLEAMYYSNANFYSNWGLGIYRYLPDKWILKKFCVYNMGWSESECESFSEIYKDPITNERIPYNLFGYSALLKSPLDWVGQDDPNIENNNDFNYTTDESFFNIGGFKEIILTPNTRSEDDATLLKDYIDEYGIIYSFTKHSDLPDKGKIHSVAIIGYGSDVGGTYFIFHDNYGSSPTGSQFMYGKIRIDDIVQAFAFIPKSDWPTYHHDNRRTGMTLLKGNIDSENDAEKSSYLSSTNVEDDVYSRTTIGDIDGNERMEIITGYSTTTDNGWITSTERRTDDYNRYRRMREKWEYDIGYRLSAPATLADINNDDNKEVIFGLYNGTLIVLEVDGDTTPKWQYTVTERDCDGNQRRGRLAYTAASDIDNDGNVEVIFADSYLSYSCPNWEGKLYVLEDDGDSYSEKDTISINNGGAYGAISLADIDSDDKQEIIVPTYYGIRVYDYDKVEGDKYGL